MGSIPSLRELSHPSLGHYDGSHYFLLATSSGVWPAARQCPPECLQCKTASVFWIEKAEEEEEQDCSWYCLHVRSSIHGKPWIDVRQYIVTGNNLTVVFLSVPWCIVSQNTSP